MKQTADKKNDMLKGVSTLDIIRKNSKIILPILMMAILSGITYGGHSTLDIVDPSFNPNVVATAYGQKRVDQVQALPDGKILAFGKFNSYNGIPTGKLIRINADGSLDTTFNNQTITSVNNTSGNSPILLQSDGKIILKHQDIVADGQPPKELVRLNSDGSLDSSFNFTLTTGIGGIGDMVSDSLNRLVIQGSVETSQGTRRLVRLNEDGSLDNSFDFVFDRTYSLGIQGDHLIVCVGDFREEQIYRLNEDGSIDKSFTPFDGDADKMVVQPDNKILFDALGALRRLNEDGDEDMGFQPSSIGNSSFQVAADGRIVLSDGGSTSTIRRLMPNGIEDTTFNQYTHQAFASFTIQPDGKIVIGDVSRDGIILPPNNSVRLSLDGTPDSTFNPGGVGFQTILPGSIRTIEPQSNGQVILGGKFDVVNDIPRLKIVRLNADSSVDEAFQINTSGSGNYFSLLRDIYQVRSQDDGKVVVTGEFDYFLNGVFKRNLVRLNSDGSIDPTFDLSISIPDYSEVNGAGKNRFEIYDDGKLMVGTSRVAKQQIAGPMKLTVEGTLDPSFNSTIFDQASPFYIDDLITQSDGKIIISGVQSSLGGPLFSFVARLNSDGSVDETFISSEELGRLRSTLLLLASGKFLVTRYSSETSSDMLERRNADGSPDKTFNSLEIENGRINALITIPNGKIFVGGSFTVLVNGNQSSNLLQLDADGNFESTTYNLNEEVLCLAIDNEGRILVGGGFTVIGANNNSGESRSYIARLVDSRARFDFDGDDKTDVGIFRPNVGEWWHLRSSDGTNRAVKFGNSADKPVPADYTGDGKTDVAFWRESTGEWFILRSEDNSFYSYPFGTAGDIPAPGDFDGDGKSDTAVFRPSNGTWYIQNSSGGTSILSFGISEDKPTVADYDGDGKDDIAIYRPSVSQWWQLRSTQGVLAVQFGSTGDQTVPADYTGDGKVDIAFWRPSNGFWHILRSEDNSFYSYPFGTAGDIPTPGDYDGDGTADTAIFRPTENVWYLLQTTNGFGAITFGNATDIPLPSVYNAQ